MASIYPFRAWHPQPHNAETISCPPYDVIDTHEARTLAEGKPENFLHVIRPEIDLPEDMPFNHPNVYEKGADNLRHFIDQQILIQDGKPAIYLYQLKWQGNTQIGLFCCVSVDEYDNDVILKHELTRPDKEDDRTRHILTQQAHSEPVMVTYKDTQSKIETLQEEITALQQPMFDFEATDGVQHTIWKIEDDEPFIEAFRAVGHLYIADGHHRCKSASRAAHTLNEGETSRDQSFNFFPAVLFPASQMHILAYNRIIHHLPANFQQQLNKRFEVKENANPTPETKGAVSLYIEGKWLGIDLPEVEDANSVEKLDAHRLQQFILEPLLAITDQRLDKNISFVGGGRGVQELVKRVDSGNAALAISMYPTAIEELIMVSDEGELMPPKSTWFEPKLRSGLLVHTF